MWRRIGYFFLLAAAIAGCKRSDNVVGVRSDDAKMNAAVQQARSSTATFITALRSPKQGQEDFAVKMAFTQGNHTEHMWVGSVTYDGARFHGTLNNQPEQVRNVRMGQRVSAAPSEISDWMYIDNGTLVGGYTIRVLRDSMSKKERAEFDRTSGFRVE